MSSRDSLVAARRGELLEELYSLHNDPAFCPPDPIELVRPWERTRDREIVALMAAVLAYGRAAQISRSVSGVLEGIACPEDYVRSATRTRLTRDLGGFKHRFTTGEQLVDLALALQDVLREWGSLENCFVSAMDGSDATVVPALGRFVERLTAGRPSLARFLVPHPAAGSACKRLHLFLRWMVRRDAVDPGGWDRVPQGKLIVPMDTHMFRLGRALGLLARRSADGRAALELTDSFRAWAPEDPVRYDFALTRLGIRAELSYETFLGRWHKAEARRDGRQRAALGAAL